MISKGALNFMYNILLFNEWIQKGLKKMQMSIKKRLFESKVISLYIYDKNTESMDMVFDYDNSYWMIYLFLFPHKLIDIKDFIMNDHISFGSTSGYHNKLVIITYMMENKIHKLLVNGKMNLIKYNNETKNNRNLLYCTFNKINISEYIEDFIASIISSEDLECSDVVQAISKYYNQGIIDPLSVIHRPLNHKMTLMFADDLKERIFEWHEKIAL